LDDDLAAHLEQERQRKGLSFKEIVNLTLRRGLAVDQPPTTHPHVSTRTHAFGFKPGIDPDKLNQLVDELEVEGFAAKISKP
jgi:hypothetical protein